MILTKQLGELWIAFYPELKISAIGVTEDYARQGVEDAIVTHKNELPPIPKIPIP